MKSKDQILLEQAYEKILDDGWERDSYPYVHWGTGGKYDWIEGLGWVCHDDPRHPDHPDNRRSSFVKKESDVFKGKNDIMWIRVMKKDVSLGVRPYKKK